MGLVSDGGDSRLLDAIAYRNASTTIPSFGADDFGQRFVWTLLGFLAPRRLVATCPGGISVSPDYWCDRTPRPLNSAF